MPHVTNVKDPVTGDAEEYELGVKYYVDNNRQLISSSSIKHNIYLDCTVEENEWATAAPRQDLVHGEDYCVIKPRSPVSLKVNNKRLVF